LTGRRHRLPPLLLVPALTLAAMPFAMGCGDDDEPARTGPDPAGERAHRPSKPPPGWRTVRNARAGFTLPVPPTWSARKRGPATLIRSDDQLVSVTVAADRTGDGRRLPARRFARLTIESLPGFKGKLARGTRAIRDTPYDAARADGRGRVQTSRVPQRITIAAFRRPGRVTYTVSVFRNARVRPRFNEPVIRRMLRGFRAQPPDFTP
jgi:hypothetical protein